MKNRRPIQPSAGMALLLLLLVGPTACRDAPEDSPPPPPKEPPAAEILGPIDLSDLQFRKRQKQHYTLMFQARPDQERYQVKRMPSAAWPKRASFILKSGETSTDNQFRVDSFVEKEAMNELGIRIDASELSVTHLPSANQFVLVRGVEVVIPTYYAEFRHGGETLYVKEGESFKIPAQPNREIQVTKVTEDSVEIEYEHQAETPERVTLTATP